METGVKTQKASPLCHTTLNKIKNVGLGSQYFRQAKKQQARFSTESFADFRFTK